jgi:hypothetical protein
MKCIVEGCSQERFMRGYCHKHYRQILRHGRILPKSVKEPNDIRLKDDYAEIVIRSAHGEPKAVAIIDKDDLERCSKLKWSWGQTAIQAVYKGKRISLSRFILGVTEKDKFAIHKDRDFLNNRRSNLAVGTKQQKAINAKTGSRNTSGHRGVSWRKDRKNGMYI